MEVHFLPKTRPTRESSETSRQRVWGPKQASNTQVPGVSILEESKGVNQTADQVEEAKKKKKRETMSEVLISSQGLTPAHTVLFGGLD